MMRWLLKDTVTSTPHGTPQTVQMSRHACTVAPPGTQGGTGRQTEPRPSGRFRQTWPFSPRRGGEYFLLALLVAPVMLGIGAIGGGPFSIGGAVLFVLGFAAVAGLIGLYTDKVPL